MDTISINILFYKEANLSTAVPPPAHSIADCRTESDWLSLRFTAFLIPASSQLTPLPPPNAAYWRHIRSQSTAKYLIYGLFRHVHGTFGHCLWFFCPHQLVRRIHLDIPGHVIICYFNWIFTDVSAHGCFCTNCVWYFIVLVIVILFGDIWCFRRKLRGMKGV